MRIIKFEFSGAEIFEPDWGLSAYPIGVLCKMMMKANEIGLQNKKIKVVEVKENFATGRKYIDFIIDETPSKEDK